MVPLRVLALALCVAVYDFAGVPKTEIRMEPDAALEENRGQSRANHRYLVMPHLGIDEKGYVSSGDTLVVEFVGSNPAPVMSTPSPLPGVANVVKGNVPAKWITGIRRFSEVRFAAIYPGIDAVYHVDDSELVPRVRLRWIVAPGADASAIRLRPRAAFAFSLYPTTASQGEGANRSAVEVGWRVLGADEVSFEIGNYDRGRPLVIESWAATAGLPGTWTVPYLDVSGTVYAAGEMDALGLDPARLGATTSPTGDICSVGPGHDGTTIWSCRDAFVKKWSSSGSLEYVTIIGGSGSDGGRVVQSDREGNAWLAGVTSSTDFPVTPDASQPRFAGPTAAVPTLSPGGDLFLMKLNPLGVPVYSTYVGGPNVETFGTGSVLRVDPAGNAYLLGGPGSSGLPVTPAAFRATNCNSCSFAAKWSSQGRMVYLTYFPALAYSIDADAAGSLYLGGTAGADFPVTPGAFGASYHGGESDAFVAKLNPTGTALVYGGFLGGSGWDWANRVAVDTKGNLWVSGFVSVPLPGGTTRTQDSNFLAKIDPSGSTILVHRDAGAEQLAVDRQDGLHMVSVHGQAALDPGGMLTGRCGQGSYAKLDAQGVLQHLEFSDSHWSFAGFAGDKPVIWEWSRQSLPDETGLAGTNAGWPQLGLGMWAFDVSDPPRQRLSCSLSAASLAGPNAVAPGEIVTLFGAGLGPQIGAGFRLDAAGRVPRELDGTRVLFDGVAAPVLYAQHGQVNAIAPFALSPGASIRIEVDYNGSRLGVPARVTRARPQFFTTDGSGSGLVAALNQDGTVNSPQNPARRGSVISLFLTGTGQATPILREGEVAASIDARPQTDFRVSQAVPGGRPLELQYVGLSPGLLNSVTQVNARLPDNITTLPGQNLLATGISLEMNGVLIQVGYISIQ